MHCKELSYNWKTKKLEFKNMFRREENGIPLFLFQKTSEYIVV